MDKGFSAKVSLTILGKSVLVVKMSAPLVTVSAMVSSEYRVTVNTPGQLEGEFNILKKYLCFIQIVRRL